MNRTDSSSAMNSLLSAYSGGDEEEDTAPIPSEIDNISDEDDDTPNPTSEIEQRNQADKRPRSITPDANPKPAKMERKATRLVSYGADDVDEDDEGEDEPKNEEEDMEIKAVKSEDDSPDRPEIYGINYQSSLDTADASSLSRTIQNLKDSEKIRIPPEPPGQCSKALQEKIRRFNEKMRNGQDLNLSIQRRKDFRNPSIYEKLILMLGIDEKGTNYPPEIYNSSIWGPESYYDELAKVQKVEMDKREKERKERTKVEFVTATKKSEQEPKRKTKWDAQPSVVSGAKPNVITTTSINPPVVSVSTSSSGAKTTVISSIGTIKKPK